MKTYNQYSQLKHNIFKTRSLWTNVNTVMTSTGTRTGGFLTPGLSSISPPVKPQLGIILFDIVRGTHEKCIRYRYV